ncbi:uncharacterized protein B0P05DRAFT_556132 [Gilbertella persicaria]|uniref:uncharacterized protein n=1 Tax=Gilbertella persicaria TaxID=101096 RepID=UPI00221FA040|nr:uncharacterized protein B0P05DRAFT_556132 [Gilbertella persicaria]KAI8062800.1 hypothetical protein B0P05DRAFT_556132 [Gilbertella persicaria]
MEQTPSVKHDNFRFVARIDPTKRILHANKQKARLHRQKKQRLQPPITHEPNSIDTTDLPLILQNYVIYIHTKLDCDKLRTLAEGLGATVKKEMDKAVTHVVIGKEHRLIQAYEKKSIVCVSPKWLWTCYSTRRHHPPVSFPVDINEDRYMLDEHTEINNPFQTEYIDYDALEHNKPIQGQLRMDQFLEADPISQQQDEGSDEFFYNQTDSEERRKAAEKRSLQAQKLIEQRQRASVASSSSAQPTIRTIAGHNNTVFGEERLRIWYGEQSLGQKKQAISLKKSRKSISNSPPPSMKKKRT